MRGPDEAQRHDQGRDQEMEVHPLRGIVGAQDGLLGEGPLELPLLAHVGELHRGARDEQGDLLAQDRVDMEDMADRPLYRRGLRRRVPRRHLDRAQGGGADSVR